MRSHSEVLEVSTSTYNLTSEDKGLSEVLGKREAEVLQGHLDADSESPTHSCTRPKGGGLKEVHPEATA